MRRICEGKHVLYAHFYAYEHPFGEHMVENFDHLNQGPRKTAACIQKQPVV